MKEQWQGFKGSKWQDEVDVRDFIQNNYKPYNGDESFLEGPTESTNTLWAELQKLQKEERAKGGVLDMETEVVSSLTAYGPGYLDKDLEKVVGLQTDKPLKRAFMPYGGIRMSEEACETYGYKPSEKLHEIFTKYHKTHNDAVFSAYTPEMRLARRNKIVTGLPDTYGRGRIVGDYRRVALYGIDYLIEQKQKDFAYCGDGTMSDDVIRQREELAEQIKALKEMKIMAASYGYDISQPAKNSLEAVQWLYFGYLAAIKTQNGAAMSVGRISTFLDIYFERDLENGVFTESEIQEIVDHVTMKFRMVKFARIPSYNQLFSGDPVWATLDVGGLGMDGRSMVTKTCFRFLHTLENMGPSPEPNLTVLYSSNLPEPFKKYAAKVSIDTSSVQYENDDVMRPLYGSDYAIACCVSAMREGKDMQFFGARCNLAKALLYSINGGIDEIKKEMLKDRCNIVLIGMPSAGKTTIGKMLEEKLGKEFFDLDDMIIAKAGKSIPEIFQESGEAGFRAIETEVAIEASKMNNKIIATGGGVVKHKVNMDFLRLNGITIFIDRDIDKLINSDPNRPLSSSKQALQQMHKERYPLYQKYAAYVAVNNANIEETVDDIVNAYHSILIDAVAE